MAVVEILNIELPDPDSERLAGFSLESPLIGTRTDASSLLLSGWVLGNPAPVVALELLHDGVAVHRLDVTQWRLDVAKGLPSIVGAERSGFKDWLDVSALGDEFTLQLMAVLEDDTRLRLAHIEARLGGAVETAAARDFFPRLGPIVDDNDDQPDPAADIALISAFGDANPDDASVVEITPRCSIVIPVHNRADLTRQCVDVILGLRSDSPSFEIVVVDDASSDDTPDLLRAYRGRVRSVTLAENGGFAAACNAGAAAARGDYLVFLNNDTIPQPGWLTALVVHADANLGAAVVGSKLLYPDDTVQHAGVSFGLDRYPHHLYAGFPTDHPAVNKTRAFRAVTAACCLVRRVAFFAVAGFDRAFVNGWEDVDLCLRLGERGHQIHYCAESVLYHLESASRNIRSDREQRNRDLYITRWLPKIEPDAVAYYVEDGLFWMASQGQLYPLRVETSPLLGMTSSSRAAADAALVALANEAPSLRRSNLLLHHRVIQAEYRADQAERRARAAGLDVTADSAPAAPEPRVLTKGQLHHPSEGANHRLVTLAFLLHPDADLTDLSPRLLAQQRADAIEFVAIARGSMSVKTEPLQKLGPTIIAVDADAYPERAARNLAATYARGPILVMLDLAVIPDDDRWLANLLAPLDEDDDAHVSVGRLLPNGTDPTDPVTDPPPVHLRATAVRAELVAEIPFPVSDEPADVDAWARAVEAAGYQIRHAETAVARPSAAPVPEPA